MNTPNALEKPAGPPYFPDAAKTWQIVVARVLVFVIFRAPFLSK
jgi:hypothetical protein